MHLQTLASGSRGNSTLIRADETRLLVDVGLTLRELDERLEAARVPPRGIHHLAVTHGHLDHAKSSGALSKRFKIPLSCSERMMQNASVRRSRNLRAIRIGTSFEVEGPRGPGGLHVTPVKVPHDADPTVAYRLEHGGRVAVILTDMGYPHPDAVAPLRGAHLILLEFNYDADMLEAGPYSPQLKRRVAGNGGHLSNEQAAEFLQRIAGPELHTLVLAHLSEKNNTPELAVRAARTALDAVGLAHVRIVIAEQDAVGPNLEV